MLADRTAQIDREIRIGFDLRAFHWMNVECAGEAQEILRAVHGKTEPHLRIARYDDAAHAWTTREVTTALQHGERSTYREPAHSEAGTQFHFRRKRGIDRVHARHDL